MTREEQFELMLKFKASCHWVELLAKLVTDLYPEGHDCRVWAERAITWVKENKQ